VSDGERAVLVTGAAGFIGSHLVDRLLARGDRVVGLDNFDPYYPRAQKERNLAGTRRHDAFELIEADIRDAVRLEEIIVSRCVGAIVHLAARAGVRPSVADPALYADVNVRGTANVLEAARKGAVTRIVYASSSSVYGGGRFRRTRQRSGPTNCRRPPTTTCTAATSSACDSSPRTVRVNGRRWRSIASPR
jgi:nucleoside-diphosphate-sugar epimerase